MITPSIGNDDNLPELRERFIKATQEMLAQTDNPQIEFLTSYGAFFGATRALSEGLLATVPNVNTEVGEAYFQEGTALPSYAMFLLSALSEYRKRRGVE